MNTNEGSAKKGKKTSSLERLPVIYVPGFGAPSLHSKYFRSRLEIEGFKVFEADLPYLQTGDARDSAAELALQVQKARSYFDSDKVNLIGHSLGGIISRYYLQKLGGWRYVEKVVYLGTPHKGTYWGVFVPMTKAGRQLVPGSELLEEMNSDPSRCKNIKCLSIVSNFDEVVVPKDSRVLECAYNKAVSWPIGHWGLVFSNRAVGWIVDFFDGLFDIRDDFAKVYEERETCPHSIRAVEGKAN